MIFVVVKHCMHFHLYMNSLDGYLANIRGIVGLVVKAPKLA